MHSLSLLLFALRRPCRGHSDFFNVWLEASTEYKYGTTLSQLNEYCSTSTRESGDYDTTVCIVMLQQLLAQYRVRRTATATQTGSTSY